MVMRSAGILYFSFFLIFCSHGQDINGFWKGRLVMEPGGCFPVYNIELQLQTEGTSIRGNSYHYSDTSNYVKEDFTGKYDTVTKSINIQEEKVSLFRIPPDCIPCVKKYSLSFHTDGKEEQLRGSWTGKTMDGKSNCPPGTIVLTRIQEPAFKPEVPPILIERKLELVKEIKVDTGNLRLDFYDNGIIDGDIISVYVNDVAVVSNQVLDAKPITIYIRIDASKPLTEMVMVGENLGSIPPNTALMIVKANDKRYQVYLTSDDKKNAMVRFIYEKPK